MARKCFVIMLASMAFSLPLAGKAAICKIKQANGQYLFTNMPDQCPKGSNYRLSTPYSTPAIRKASFTKPVKATPVYNPVKPIIPSSETLLTQPFPVASNYTSSSKIYTFRKKDGTIVFTDSPTVGATEWHGRPQPFNYARFLPNLKINRSKFTDLIATTAYKYNLDPDLLHAVIRVESAYNPRATSSAGAVGLMQLMPGTAQRYGVYDRHDPAQNVEGGARYLRDLIAMFNSDLTLAIAAYNAGENAVIKYNNSIPPYRETQNYVRQVLSLYSKS